MAFFGLTMLGSQAPLQECLWEKLNLSMIDAEHISQSFEQFTSGARAGKELGQLVRSEIESAEHEKEGFIREKTLEKSWDACQHFLRFVYRIEPPQPEIDLLWEQIKITDTKTVTKIQLMNAVSIVQRKAKELSAGTGPEYRSAREMYFDRWKNHYSFYSPQYKFRKPVTTAQQLGWFKASSLEKVTSRRGKLTCPETKFAAAMHADGLLL